MLLLPSGAAAVSCSATGGSGPHAKHPGIFMRLQVIFGLRQCFRIWKKCNLLKSFDAFVWGMSLFAEHLAATQLHDNSTSILFKLSDLSPSAMKLLFLG